MSNLRIAGIVIGTIGLLFTFLFYRGHRWKRSNFSLLMLFSISLISISLKPSIVNFARDVLALQEASRGRIIALLIFSNIFLLFYSFYKNAKLEKLHTQFDGLVRKLAVSQYTKDTIFQNTKPIMILIPALNEADNLRELLPRLPRKIGDFEVGALVVDDGSDDGTALVASADQNISVVENLINRGGGAALRLGYDMLKNGGAEICITMDADGQHQPEEVEKLVLPILEEEADLVIGSRILGQREQDSRLRITGVILFGKIITLLTGKKITDPSSGFRAFRICALDKISLHEDQYHTSELLIETIRKGLRLKEVPITILKRRHGKSKKGKNLTYGFHFAKIIFKTWWR